MAGISFRIEDGILIVRFAVGSKLDSSQAQPIGNELNRLIDSIVPSELKGILLNFEGIEFMSSAMIGKLVLFNKLCKHHRLQLKFCNIRPSVLEVFKITRPNRDFEVVPDPFGDPPDPEDDDPGTAGITANLKRPPGSGGGHASPPPSQDS